MFIQFFSIFHQVLQELLARLQDERGNLRQDLQRGSHSERDVEQMQSSREACAQDDLQLR